MVRWSGMTGGGRCSVGVCSGVGEEERGTVSGAGCSGAEVPLLQGPGEGAGATIMAGIGGETGGGVNGSFKRL
jgi:hypothetical protein